jgi:site-specific recombinase XerD
MPVPAANHANTCKHFTVQILIVTESSEITLEVMMIFYNSCRGKFYYSFRDEYGRRRQICCQTSSKKEAERFVKRFKDGRVQSPPLRNISRPKVASQLLLDFGDEYLEYVQSLCYTSSSVKANKSALQLLAKRIGNVPLSSITVESCDKFIYSGQPSLETAAKYHSQLKAIFRKAVEWERIDFNPFTKVRKPKVKQKLPEIFSNEDYQLLLARLHLDNSTQRLRRMVIVAHDSGMRLSEILFLRRTSVLFDKRRLIVGVFDDFTPKSKKPRATILSLPAEEAIKKQLLENDSSPISAVRTSLYVFPNRHGSPFSKGSVDHPFKIILKQLFPTRQRLRFHSLRHTFGCLLVETGVSLAKIHKLMGHSTIKMTEQYARFRSDSFEDALEAFDGTQK